MHITLTRSGGFTGISQTLQVDTATLSADQTQPLFDRVVAADFFRLPTTLPGPLDPDQFDYTLTITEGDRSHTVTCAETALPETLRSLIKMLRKIAKLA